MTMPNIPIENKQFSKNIKLLIGVTGGIAAYKSCELVRLFVKAGCEVKVIMTNDAKQFVHPNTFAALTGYPVYDSCFADTGDAMVHITLAKWADILIIAPASASTLARLSHGFSDNLLATVCLVTTARCFVAPAMNKEMWEKPVTQANITRLKTYGYTILEPEAGEQACGDVGFGRMMAPEDIFEKVFSPCKEPVETKVVITAGPTVEKIDPVRYLSNFSSGKMGYAMAKACVQKGAEVVLISGPTALEYPLGCKVISVSSTAEMYEAVMAEVNSGDIFISAAAVADYRPQHISSHKIKKHVETLQLELVKNVDILSEVTKSYPHIFAVGFCAETEDLLDHAHEKLKRKHLSAIIANMVTAEGYPFNASTNCLTYLTSTQEVVLEQQSKHCLAYQLMQLIMHDYQSKIAEYSSVLGAETDAASL